MDVKDKPLTVISACIVILHPEGPGESIIGQSIGEDNPHEVRQVLLIGDKVVVELIVEHFQGSFGDHHLSFPVLVVVPVIGAG